MTAKEAHTNKTILRVLLAAAAVLLLCGAAAGAAAGAPQEGSWTGEVFTPDPAGYTDPANLVADLNKTGTDGEEHTGTADEPESGTIRLLKNVKLGGTLFIGNPDDTSFFTLDLNDKVLSRNSTSGDFPVITVDSNHRCLTLTDFAEKKTVKYFNVDDKGLWTLAEEGVSTEHSVTGGYITGGRGQGGGVNVLDGGYLWMDGGNIVGNGACGDSINGLGGGVYVLGDAASGTFSTFSMIGGKIIGNYANSGGGVYVGNHGVFDMSAWKTDDGGSIEENSANNGGGVYVSGGEFIMTGKTVIRGNSAPQGGGVCVGSGKFTVGDPGCYIIENKADSGGGVCVTGTNSTFRMFDGTITGNTAALLGGGVYVESGSFEMEGAAAVSGNKADSGGGVCLYGAETEFTMGGTAKITENETLGMGGGVYVENGSFEMKDDAAVSGNEANDPAGYRGSGGGVYVADGAFTMSGTTKVTGNKATGSGGGVFVRKDGEFKVSGSPVIKNNTGKKGTDNVSLSNEDNLSLTAPLTGGEIRISKVGSNPLEEGGKFGTAEEGASGAGYFIADGVNLMGSINGENYLIWIVKPAEKKSSSRSQGTSIWLTEIPTTAPVTAQTAAPIETQTPSPEAPEVKPIAGPSDAPASTPAPFAGVLAGLGAAAVVFAVRMRR